MDEIIQAKDRDVDILKADNRRLLKTNTMLKKAVVMQHNKSQINAGSQV
jgi:hypothetical protein